MLQKIHHNQPPFHRFCSNHPQARIHPPTPASLSLFPLPDSRSNSIAVTHDPLRCMTQVWITLQNTVSQCASSLLFPPSLCLHKQHPQHNINTTYFVIQTPRHLCPHSARSLGAAWACVAAARDGRRWATDGLLVGHKWGQRLPWRVGLGPKRGLQ